LNVPEGDGLAIGFDDAGAQAPVVVFEAFEEQSLDPRLVGGGPERAFGVSPFELRLLVGEPPAESGFGPLAAPDRFEEFAVALEVDVAFDEDLLDLTDQPDDVVGETWCPVLNSFICPSATRQGTGRDSVNLTNSPEETALNIGYGYFDYAPVSYVDINVVNGVATIPSGTPTQPAVPYRNKATTASGMLKNGKTTIAEITDGTSNTIALIECAGRDERYISQYADGYAANTPNNIGYPFLTRGSGVPPGPHRFWRWADPGNTFGISGQPNNPAPISQYVRDTSSWPNNGLSPSSSVSSTIVGGQGGANEESFSFHPGGVNVLLGDGSVRFIKSTINLAAFRGILTPSGGEVISADQY